MLCAVCGCHLTDAAEGGLCPHCGLASALTASTSAHRTRPGEVEGFELIEQLGAGGMGVVWLARDVVLDRLVALKLIPAGADASLADRLLREGQAVARLHHPHVVTVHGLGRRNGSIFLAMEFLDGGNLDEKLGGKAMAPRAAAALLRGLADGVEHAHAAGVLHRDIKPSNVLLDQAGTPHLADFGLAIPHDGSGELTRPGQVLGTPAYLAPELLRGARQASPATDVYGLGAVLYSALTGRAPFAADAVAAVLEQVRGTEPAAPRVLKPDIPRDLETICLRCLEKSPASRYPSAAAVRDELDRFLAGRPVQARPVGRAEKLWRWAGRNPALAAAWGAAALLLVALAVGGPVAALRIERSRRAAEQAAASSRAVSDFLANDLLAQAAPGSQADHDVKLRTVLDRAEKKIDGRFTDQPEVEAALRETLARTYQALGDYATMKRELDRALPLRTRVSGRSNPATLRLQNSESVAAYRLGRLKEGEELAQASLAACTAALGPKAPETLAAMNNLVSIYFAEGNYRAARDLGEKTVALKREALGARDQSTLLSLINLGLAYDNVGDFAKGEAADREALAGLSGLQGPDGILTLYVRHNLATIEADEGRLEEARRLAESTLAARLRVLGPEHPETLRTKHLLGEVRRLQGDPAGAAALLREVLAAQTRLYGPHHPDTDKTRRDLTAAERALHAGAAAK